MTPLPLTELPKPSHFVTIHPSTARFCNPHPKGVIFLSLLFVTIHLPAACAVQKQVRIAHPTGEGRGPESAVGGAPWHGVCALRLPVCVPMPPSPHSPGCCRHNTGSGTAAQGWCPHSHTHSRLECALRTSAQHAATPCLAGRHCSMSVRKTVAFQDTHQNSFQVEYQQYHKSWSRPAARCAAAASGGPRAARGLPGHRQGPHTSRRVGQQASAGAVWPAAVMGERCHWAAAAERTGGAPA